MIIGDPSLLAIESKISQAYKRLSFRGLGYFVVHIKGKRYGVFESEATMLGCSFDEVEKRISDRGGHTAVFSREPDAGKIADAFRGALYTEVSGKSFFGMSAPAFAESINSTNIQWAPDGDEAFDDGSYILQFDIDDKVRLIAFGCRLDGFHDPSTLSDLWIASDQFYWVLESWRDAFIQEWTSLPKVAE